MKGDLQLDELIGEASNGPVRRVGNKDRAEVAGNGRRRRANSRAMIAGSPEVMVKISGFGRGRGVLKALEYVSHRTIDGPDGEKEIIELEVELRDGSKIAGREAIKEIYESWRSLDVKRHPRQRDTMNLILSMPPGTDRELVEEASRRFARETFAPNYEYLMATHRDDDHPHTHLIVQMRGDDGRRLNPRKHDLQEWRQRFADRLRDLGVDAAATPRFARGRTMKAERQVLRHIRKKANEPVRVDAAKKQDAVRSISEGAEYRPWEEAIVAKQRAVRATYAGAVTTLLANKDVGAQQLGSDLKGFLDRMPEPTTERHRLAEALLDEVRRKEHAHKAERDR